MKGKREEGSDLRSQMLGLAILRARTPLYEMMGLKPRQFDMIGAFMGISDERVRQIEQKALRKVRTRVLWILKQLGLELREALRAMQ